MVFGVGFVALEGLQILAGDAGRFDIALRVGEDAVVLVVGVRGVFHKAGGVHFTQLRPSDEIGLAKFLLAFVIDLERLFDVAGRCGLRLVDFFAFGELAGAGDLGLVVHLFAFGHGGDPAGFDGEQGGVAVYLEQGEHMAVGAG